MLAVIDGINVRLSPFGFRVIDAVIHSTAQHLDKVYFDVIYKPRY